MFSKIQTEEGVYQIEDIHSLAPPCDIGDLSNLRRKSIKPLEQVMASIADGTKLKSELSQKSDASAIDKVKRPVVKQKYPWMDLAHLRDFLRFRTHLQELNDFQKVFSILVDLQSERKLSIVKVDTAKLLRPGEFGWRMIATDIRLETGLLVEHYMTYSDLIQMNEDRLHRLYEDWRGQDSNSLPYRKARERFRDATLSKAAYRELFLQFAVRDTDSTKLDTDRKSALSSIYSQIEKNLGLQHE